jgi:ATP-dependent Clp protease protease subunit
MKFWDFKAAAEKKGELYLYGEISDTSWWGDEVTPAQFQKDLAALGDIDVLDVYINSPGGDVFAGIAIYNILKRHNATVNVHVDGLAASAASIIAMAGDKIVMPKAATMMIHNASSFGWGNKIKLQKLVDELGRIDGQLADIYTARTKRDKANVVVWMDNERWMSGDEAFADGFADEVEENKAVAACADAEKYFSRYQHPPRSEPNKPAAADKGGTFIPENPRVIFDDGKFKAIEIVPFSPDNGAVIPQPVADKTPDALKAALTDQRKHFNDIKRKLYGGLNNG